MRFTRRGFLGEVPFSRSPVLGQWRYTPYGVSPSPYRLSPTPTRYPGGLDVPSGPFTIQPPMPPQPLTSPASTIRTPGPVDVPPPRPSPAPRPPVATPSRYGGGIDVPSGPFQIRPAGPTGYAPTETPEDSGGCPLGQFPAYPGGLCRGAVAPGAGGLFAQAFGAAPTESLSPSSFAPVTATPTSFFSMGRPIPISNPDLV